MCNIIATREIFAERITELRKERGLKRQQVADDLGITRASLEFYEKGKRKPDIEMTARIAKYYNVSADYLLGLSKTPSLLLPCPFCGGRADIYYRHYESPCSECYGYNEVGCLKCGIFFSTKHYEMQHPNAELKLEKDKRECIKAWNRRV